MNRQMRVVAMTVAAVAFILAGVAISPAAPASDSQPAGSAGQESSATLLARAQAEADAGHNADAKTMLSAALVTYPNDVGLHKLLGDVDYRTGDYAGAAAAYGFVLSRNPKDKEVHNKLGGVYAAQDKYDAAIAEFRASLPLEEGLSNLIRLYIDEGRLPDLEAEERRNLMTSQMEPTAHFDLGLVYYYEKKYDLSMSEFQQALTLDVSDDDAHNGVGMVYGELGKHQDAMEQYRQIIAHDPGYSNAWINWGVELIAVSDYNGAITKLNHALSIKPNSAVAYGDMGVAYDYLGNFTQAIELYERALQLDPRASETYQNLGSLYFNHNLLNLAEAAFIKGIAISPHRSELHFDLGVVYEQQRKYDLAAEQYKAALAASPGNVQARQQLAAIQARLTQPGQTQLQSPGPTYR
jgi:tetratricopeptide (TPR) repeat protein